MAELRAAHTRHPLDTAVEPLVAQRLVLFERKAQVVHVLVFHVVSAFPPLNDCWSPISSQSPPNDSNALAGGGPLPGRLAPRWVAYAATVARFTAGAGPCRACHRS